MLYDPKIFTLYESLDNEQYIVALYYCEQHAADLLLRAGAVAVEQSTGTWTPVPEETEDVRDRCGARVIGVYEFPDVNTGASVIAEERKFMAAIAYPIANINGQIPELLTVLYGNISMSHKLKLMDVFFPKSFVSKFNGPKFGIQGLRKLLKIEERPFLLGMIKPCIGASPKTIGKLLYEMGLGGVDIVKDDELLADPEFCPVEARIEECMKNVARVKKETGHTVLYTVNITDSPEKMHQKAHKAIKSGVNALMVNLYVIGYSALQELAEDKTINVPILAHPAMSGMYYASPNWGMTASLALGKFVRLSGADMLIYPSQFGKIPLVKERAIRVAQELQAPFYHLNSTLPGPSAGNHPGIVGELINNYGNDIVIGAGGGIHGHPDGATAGCKAFHQAFQAAMSQFPLREAATKHKELRKALDKWGVVGEGQPIYDLVK